MLFQTLDALAHRAVGDVHLLCGMGEIQVSGSRFEEAKRLERRKCARHPAMIAVLTADAATIDSNRRIDADHPNFSLVLIALNMARQPRDDRHVLAHA